VHCTSTECSTISIIHTRKIFVNVLVKEVCNKLWCTSHNFNKFVLVQTTEKQLKHKLQFAAVYNIQQSLEFWVVIIVEQVTQVLLKFIGCKLVSVEPINKCFIYLTISTVTLTKVLSYKQGRCLSRDRLG